MSFWQTLIVAVVGGVLTIAGGFVAVWWQTKRADATARLIRRQEREEQALLTLFSKTTEVMSRLSRIKLQAETSALTAQYHAARRALDELTELWHTNLGAIIHSEPVQRACLALTITTDQLLPTGTPQEMQYPEDEPQAKAEHFRRDLGQLYDLTSEVAKQVMQASEAFL